jgi:tmRNA-binding protein
MRLSTRNEKKNVVTDAFSKISSGEVYAMVVSTISNNIIKENKRSWRKILLYKPSFLFIYRRILLLTPL